MSLQQFQAATALLIRLPEENRSKDLTPFLEKFTLNESEKSRLIKLADDRGLKKYGKSMSGVRWETVSERMPFSLNYLRKPTLDYLWKRFEAQVTHIRGTRLTHHFFDYLLSDDESLSVLDREGNPFLLDLLKIEQAQARLWLGEFRGANLLAANSRLLHRHFEIVDLDHDIPQFIRNLSGPEEDKVWERGPELRPLKVLIIEGEDRDCRYFQIDGEVDVFLNSQLGASPPQKNLPQSYEDLVSIGLGKPIN